MKIKLFYSSIPVFIIGLIVTYLLCFSNCGGIIEIYSSIFLIGLLAFYLAGFCLYSAIGYFVIKAGINVRPLMMLLIFIGLVILVKYFDSEEFKSRVILEAKESRLSGIHFLLRKNNKAEFNYGHFEERCSCKGNYLLKGDTILISGVEKYHKFKISNKYLITNLYVVPLNRKQTGRGFNQIFEKIYQSRPSLK